MTLTTTPILVRTAFKSWMTVLAVSISSTKGTSHVLKCCYLFKVIRTYTQSYGAEMVYLGFRPMTMGQIEGDSGCTMLMTLKVKGSVPVRLNRSSPKPMVL
jgi:hypothetical protein